MNNSSRAWVIRTHPHGIPRIAEFLHGNLVALGWPGVGNLKGKDRDQIKIALRKTYKNHVRWIGAGAGSLDMFVNQVANGDRVIVPSPEDGAVYVGKFCGDYRYVKSKDSEKEGYPHQRKVKWLLGMSRIPRYGLPATISSSLRAQQPIFSTDAKALNRVLSGHSDNPRAGPTYHPEDGDDRAISMRQIRERRGQPAFRRALLNCYENRCAVSGCNLVELLEAAHIHPYRGNRDNCTENGLLLRADLHTLFDLDLLGIEPQSLRIRFHPVIDDVEYRKYAGKHLLGGSIRASREALRLRWQSFQQRRRRG